MCIGQCTFNNGDWTMDYPIPARVVFQKSAVEQAAISGTTVRPGQNHMVAGTSHYPTTCLSDKSVYEQCNMI